MYGLTRGATTLIGVLVAGFLIWLGVDPISDGEPGRGEYWWAVLMCALAGFVIALSQLLGGWTKWGWPRISFNVFLLGFIPALIAGGWVLLYAQPGNGPQAGNVRDWSEDLGIEGLMGDLAVTPLTIAFALGLVFGLTFDTTGPVVRRRGEPVVADDVRRDRDDDDVRRDRDDDDERRVRITEGGTPAGPHLEPDDRRPEDRR
jgi:hypothetical protein